MDKEVWYLTHGSQCERKAALAHATTCLDLEDTARGKRTAAQETWIVQFIEVERTVAPRERERSGVTV